MVVVELGTDMSRLPDTDHAADWTGSAPGQNERAAKRKRAGGMNLVVRQALIFASWAVSHTKNTFLWALCRCWVRRMPMKKTVVALVHRLLVIIVKVLNTGEDYHDLGPTYHDEHDRVQIVHRTERRMEKLGYRVQVEIASDPGDPAAVNSAWQSLVN